MRPPIGFRGYRAATAVAANRHVAHSPVEFCCTQRPAGEEGQVARHRPTSAGVAAEADAGLIAGYALDDSTTRCSTHAGARRDHYGALFQTLSAYVAREPRGSHPHRERVVSNPGHRLHGLRRRRGHRADLPLRPDPAHRPGAGVDAARARPDPAHARAQPVPPRRLPRPAHPQRRASSRPSSSSARATSGAR